MQISACDLLSDRQEMDWDVTPDGLECTNPDQVTADGTCVWHCRDFKHQEDADLRVSYTHDGLRMQIVPSANCPKQP